MKILYNSQEYVLSSAERFGIQDDGAEKVQTSLGILKSGKLIRDWEVDTMVRRVDGCSVPTFLISQLGPQAELKDQLPCRSKVCDFPSRVRMVFPGRFTTVFPQQPGQKVAIPRVERVFFKEIYLQLFPEWSGFQRNISPAVPRVERVFSMTYLSNSVHSTSGLNEFP